MTSWHFRAASLRRLRTTWWSVGSSAPHFTWTSRIWDSNEFTPRSLTSGRLEANTLIQPTQTEAPPPPPYHIEFTCNEISFSGENSNTLSPSQGVSVLPVPPSITEDCGKKWVQPAPLQTPGCRVRAECWWEPWLDGAAVTQPPTKLMFHRGPTVTGQEPHCTVPNSQSPCRWSVQLEPACIFLCIVSNQEPRSLFWTGCFLMVSYLNCIDSESLQNLSVSIQK